MYYYIMPTKNPKENLAIEEVCFKYWNHEAPLLLLWQNEDAIVVGKHQNIHEEVNMKFVKNSDVTILRRISGGGTVYHDAGNVNYSLIFSNSRDLSIDVKEISQIIVNGLRDMGLHVEISERNDLRLDGKKISGTAQARSGNQVLHHGTLLFNSNLPKLKEALTVNHEKVFSKGVQSVSSHVTNIAPYMKGEYSIEDFVDLLLTKLSNHNKMTKWQLPECLNQEILTLRRDKYSKWTWNFGKSRDYQFRRQGKFSWGKIKMEVELKHSTIQDLTLESPCISNDVLDVIEKTLRGVNYNETSIMQALEGVGIKEVFESSILPLVAFLAGA